MTMKCTYHNLNGVNLEKNASKINVIIIDSGVNITHPAFQNDIILAHNLSDCSNIGTDDYGHGTAIYGILRKCSEANIYNLKINMIENGVEASDLIFALEYVLENIPEANIINLSLGVSVLDDEKLYETCVRLSERGVIIVSAFDNTNCISYPAAFENVIGVTTGVQCKKANDFVYIDDSIVNIAAKGGIQRVCWTSPEYLLLGGNSFACAHVTSQIVKYMALGVTEREEILKEFQKDSIEQITIHEDIIPQKDLFQIDNAVLFPFNKEMHSLLRYSYLLPFQITGVYDVKYAASVGARTTHLMKDVGVKDILIKNINEIDYDSFDTMILGHTSELIKLIDDPHFVEQLVENLLNKGKQVYSFDDHDFLEINDTNNIFVPKVDHTNLPSSRFGMLYRISKPVIGVFGTSSMQGKFTLQLKLRELFLSCGYKVGQIGTEPSSVLFGMDYAYPMGYNASVYISDFDSIRYLNHITNELCKTNDLIIVGSQSGSVSFDFGNINQWNIAQYCFVCGTQPDIIILCVNPFDDIEYIDRSIKFLESSVNSKVIALVVYPINRSSNWSGYLGGKEKITLEDFDSIQLQLKNELKREVYLLGDHQQMFSLMQLIIDYFSES